MERFYDCEEVAKRYGVKIETVYKWVHDGKLESVRIGRMIRFKEEHLLEFEKRMNGGK